MKDFIVYIDDMLDAIKKGVSYSELSSLMETAHLLRSPKNARRLLTSLNRALSQTEPATTLDDFKKELGFE